MGGRLNREKRAMIILLVLIAALLLLWRGCSFVGRQDMPVLETVGSTASPVDSVNTNPNARNVYVDSTSTGEHHGKKTKKKAPKASKKTPDLAPSSPLDKPVKKHHE